MSDQYQIKDLSSLHKYRTELPNIIFELGLTADHIGVYSLLKRIAGDSGSCFSSNTKLGEKLKMTAKTFSNFKDDLQKPFDLLDGLSLIESQERNTPEKGRQSDLVTIVDIWPINMQFMANLYKTPPLVKITEGPTSKLPTPLVKITDEEDLVKKTFVKEQTTTPTPSFDEPQKPKSESVVVVPLDKEKEEKLNELKKVKLSHGLIESSMTYSLPDIQNAVKCCLNSFESIKDMDAYYWSALTKKWQPKPSKEKLAKQQEETQKNEQQARQKLYIEAKQLEVTHKYNLKKNASFSVNENTISLKIDNGFSPLEMTEQSLKILKDYINKHRK